VPSLKSRVTFFKDFSLFFRQPGYPHALRGWFTPSLYGEGRGSYELCTLALFAKHPNLYPPHHIGMVGTPLSAAGWFGVRLLRKRLFSSNNGLLETFYKERK